MPVMDGHEAIRRIRAAAGGKEPKIIAVTASAMDENRQELLAIGADDFIGKPFQEAELFQKIHAHLGVEFLYAERGRSCAARRRRPSLTPESLACLPHDLIHLMREAVIAADLDQLLAKIEDVEAIAPDIARGLRALAPSNSNIRSCSIYSVRKSLGQRPRTPTAPIRPKPKLCGRGQVIVEWVLRKPPIDRNHFDDSFDRTSGEIGTRMQAETSESRNGQMVMPRPAAGELPVDRTASILVVDDVSANLRVLTGMLKDRGYKVRPVPSGELALLAARKDPPDLILLDINMPEMNGYEVCQQLKSDEALRGVPVIFISALNENLDKVKAFALGGVDYITKPFQMEELHARVETHLKLRRLQVELEETNSRLERVNGRMSRDLEAAAKIQKTFLPSAAPRIPGTEFAWCYQPCDELAGDGLNIVPLGDGKVSLYILDVSGHGVSSALLSVTLSRLLSPPSDPSSILIRDRTVLDCLEVTPPAEVADRLNRLFPYDTATEQFATLMYGVLDVSSGDFRYVSAGHPGPIYLPAGGPPVILQTRDFRSAWRTRPMASAVSI